MAWGCGRVAARLAAWALALTAGRSCAGASQDWLMWGNNFEHTSLSNANNVSAASTFVSAWNYTLAGPSVSQPVVAMNLGAEGANRVFIGDEEGFIHSVDLNTGLRVWRVSVGVQQTSCWDLPLGRFGASATVFLDRARNALYAMGGDGYLYELDARSGATNWKLKLLDPTLLHSYGAVNVLGDTVLVTAASYCDHGSYRGAVISVSRTSRKVLKKIEPASPGMGAGVWGSAGVTLFNGSAFFATGNVISGGPEENSYLGEHVVKIDQRSFAVQSKWSPGVLEGDADFGASVVIVKPRRPTSTCTKTLALVENKVGWLFVLDAHNLSVIQTVEVMEPSSNGRFIMSPAFWPYDARFNDDDYIFVNNPKRWEGQITIEQGLVTFKIADDCTLTFVRATGVDGESDPSGNYVFSSPVATQSGIVFMGTGFSNAMIAIDGKTGERVWKYQDDIGGPLFQSPTVTAGKVLFAGWGTSGNGGVGILRAFEWEGGPTMLPTEAPSLAPTEAPSRKPTTAKPTRKPVTAKPTRKPITARPTTLSPTRRP